MAKALNKEEPLQRAVSTLLEILDARRGGRREEPHLRVSTLLEILARRWRRQFWLSTYQFQPFLRF